VRSLIDRLQPTLPILLANLVSVGEVALTYQPNLEQVLVLAPQLVAEFAGIYVPDIYTKKYQGAYIDFALNLNLPPPCTTGYLPVQQQRPPSSVDYPDRPVGDLYCRIPQDSPLNVRGMRNLPCETRPGKRAPTVKMCESDENYIPLNDGFNWKGDPNATPSGQAIPQLPPGTPPAQGLPQAQPPTPIAQYDPATGTYMGPDGQTHTQTDLGAAGTAKTWREMILPPGG
jgi:phospholipid/cholesterol/gamma-HCH transport system substrate-binding protein